MATKRLPPGCGEDVGKPLLYNVHQQDMQTARRQRFCPECKKIALTNEYGQVVCTCGTTYRNNLRAPRLYHRFMLRAGRRSGKSLIGAHAVLEELMIPNSLWWVCGPTFKILYDGAFPTLVRLIPPHWVKNWSEEHQELTLTNGSKVQFRSLDDPERARGQGLHGVWLDEAAFIIARAWDVLEPSLGENAGIVIATTSPDGFDWSYKAFMTPALVTKTPGFWARRFKTIDNPRFSSEPLLVKEIENARLTKTPEVFAAEYEGEDVNATGLIYGQSAARQVIPNTDEGNALLKKMIPEWPTIDAARQILIGLDSGSDHPFGATKAVVTEFGIVFVSEYLERMQANSIHLPAIQSRFGTHRFPNVRWSSNKNEVALRLEFGLKGVGVIPAENAHTLGIQRVQSWLLTGQMFFAHTCPILIEQMASYRHANNYLNDGQKKETEQVFKKEDELPDCVRYTVMAWPELPKVDAAPMTDEQKKRWEKFDDKTRVEIAAVREFNKRSTSEDLQPEEGNYPTGGFFNPFEQFWN